jgi:hypothetical protein
MTRGKFSAKIKIFCQLKRKKLVLGDQCNTVLGVLSQIQDGDKFYRKQLLERGNILLFSTK